MTRPLQLLVGVLVASLAGCNVVSEPPAEPIRPPLTIFASTAGIEAALELSRDGKTLTGTRTVHSPDGQLLTEEVVLPLAAVPQPAVGEAITVPGVAGLELRLTRTEPLADGTRYLFTSNQGHELTLDTHGESGYAIIPALLLIASVGAIFFLTACGILAWYAIQTCAGQHKCWDYNISRGLCSGLCRNC